MGINILEWGLLEEVPGWGSWWGVAIDMMVWGGSPQGDPHSDGSQGGSRAGNSQKWGP